MFKIAEASQTDIPAIIGIAEITWWRAYSQILSEDQLQYMLHAIYAPETLKSQMLQGTQTYLVLTTDEDHQAFASFGRRPEDSRVYKIHKLYVLPQNQKKGYGQALIDEIKNRVAAKNIRTLDLNVNRFNPARKFYERLGFKVIREEDVPVGPYWMNDYVMRLEF